MRSLLRPLLWAALGLLLVGCAPETTLPPVSTLAPRPAATATGRAAPATPPPAAASTAKATAAPLAASPVPASFNPADYTFTRVAGGLERPTFLTHAGDGSGRLFVVEQPGRVRLVQGGALLPTPFLDLTDRVNANANERGLLGLAFSPHYAQTGEFFVYYTDADGAEVIARFKVSADPARADPASEQVILRIPHPGNTNHNGGNLAFGPDGYLYAGVGDGGGAGDQPNNAQNLGVLLGKLLRLDVNQPPYAIPPDNPFTQQAGARPEIWAYGLRNPWRFAFDRATGDLYIADVGQNLYEEIDVQPAASHGGENYGWRFREGLHPFQGAAPAGLVDPVSEYSHSEGGCAVTGGYVYRGAALPALGGVYFLGDYCTGQVWTLTRAASGQWLRQPFTQLPFQISSFGEDQAGELYLLNHNGGEIYQLTAAR